MATTEHRFQPLATGRSFELVSRELRKAIVSGELERETVEHLREGGHRA